MDNSLKIDLSAQKPLKAFAQRLSEKFSSLESLLESILSPLHTLGLIHSGNSSSDAKNTLDSSFWMRDLPRIHASLLTYIAVDWRPSLIQHNHWHSIYYAWFGLSNPDQSSTPDIKHVSPQIGSKLSYVAIESMLSCLSSQASSNRRGPLHPETLATITELMSRILESYSLHDWYLAFFENLDQSSSRHAIQQNEEWRRFIKTLLSVPDKIANASSCQINCTSLPFNQDILDRTSFLVQLSVQLEGLVSRLSKSTPTPFDVGPLSFLVSKLIRVGFVTVDINSDTSQRKVDLLSSIWSTLLSAVARQDGEMKAYLRTWNQIISDLPRDELRTFLASFVAHTQVKMCLDDIGLDINDKSCTKEEATAQLYDCYLGSLGGEACTEEEESEITELVQDLVIDRPGWNFGTARSISRWMAHDNAGGRSRSSLAKRALRKLSGKAQIAHGSASHHTFLLLIFLLNACPINQKPCTIDFSCDMDFMEGVHLSLGSLRTRFRLLGMLMAELVTGFEISGGQAKLPKHDFGPEVWNSNDDDTKLCKMIRVLTENWSSLVNKRTPWTLVIVEQAATTCGPTLHCPKPPTFKQHGCSEESVAPTRKMLPSEKNAVFPDLQTQPLTENRNLLADIQRLSVSAPSSKQKKPLIEVLRSSSPELKPYAISDEDLAELNGDVTAEAEASHAVDHMFNSHTKAKIREPVYLYDLIDYLKDSENCDKIEIGLKTAERLIRRKAGWGNELVEHGVDLTFALLLLQDNFDLVNFSLHRQAALTALVATVPQKVAPCLIEQLFFHQYSITQRICMLNALVLGAKELAKPRSTETEIIRFNDPKEFVVTQRVQPSHITSSQSDTIRSILDSRTDLLSDMTRDLTKHTLEKVRSNTNDQNELALQATSGPKTTRISSALQKSRQERHPIIPQTEPARLAALATEYFIMPMINRMWIYLTEASSAKLNKGRGQPYLGSGWAILLQPILLSRFVQSLTVLVYLSRSSLDFLNVYMVESFVLALKLRAHVYESGLGGEEAVESALLELVLTVLDVTISSGGGWKLVEVEAEAGGAFSWSATQASGGGFVSLIGDWAAAVVELEQNRNAGELSRTGLAAVGILVIIERLRKNRVERHHSIC